MTASLKCLLPDQRTDQRERVATGRAPVKARYSRAGEVRAIGRAAFYTWALANRVRARNLAGRTRPCARRSQRPGTGQELQGTGARPAARTVGNARLPDRPRGGGRADRDRAG